MKHNSKRTICEQASIFYYDYIQNTRLSIVNPEILSHIEKCTFCQSEIERLKVALAEMAATGKPDQKDIQLTTILASHFNLVNKEVTCGIAKQFLFSLAGLPFEIGIPTPIIVHIDNCNQCKSDLKTLRNLKLTSEQLTRLGRVIASLMTKPGDGCELYSGLIESSAKSEFDNDTLAVLKNIIEREESGVVTKYVTKERTDVEISKGLSADSENWPVEVMVYDRRKEKAKTGLTHSLTGSCNHVRYLVKPLAAIAAMVFVAVWLFVGSFAKAIEFDDIYNTIGKIKNICLISGASEVNETTQKVWISKDLNIKLFYSADHWILWDIQNKIRNSRTGELTYSETNSLGDAELINVRQTMDIPLALLPFQNPRLLPDKYDWKLLPEKEVARRFSNTQVYDLLWSNKTVNGSLIYYKWRVYIDKNNLLPKRVENWQKYSPSEKYELKNWMDITYPQTYEVEKLIREIGLAPK